MKKWRPIYGFEGSYEVAEDGEVRSLTRTVTDKNGRSWEVKGRTMRPAPHWYGYPRVSLSREGRAKMQEVHVVVLEAFVGPRPEGHIARHLDGNPKNNHVSNLQWGTELENKADMREHGTVVCGTKVHSARLNPDGS